MSEPQLPDTGARTLEVTRVVVETHDAVSLVFAVPHDDPDRFRYRPGQFLTLRVPSEHTGSVARCYSLSSSPHHDTELKVTVKRVTDGYGSNWLCDNIVPGSTVEVLPPAGVFTPHSWDEDLLLVAGGSGITPVVSILKSALAEGTGRIVVVYANRDEKSVIFAEELRRWTEQYPDRVTVVHWLESVQGLPSETTLRTLFAPYRQFHAFVCGPEAFMDASSAALKSLGLPRERRQVERFLSLEQNPFDHDAADEAATDSPDAGEATVHVDLDGEQRQLAWPRNKRLLDLLLEQGMDAPFSCRQGACSACACRVDKGDVTMVTNAILEQEDLDEGIVLACQSLPVTDEVHVSYE
ncbi:2Fe-2S iron-sulfur cluster binding domain-containing protein [Allosaccharopolyspora coralli]|uniref:2Fe-2S iron-sulfur cluster binding domain-containing protein n=1 Tax=Allosaccharopolyspora coralli TaxID=2665642 RepID=A0A5Q3Q968_9PSEU|nr:ferredoxin--NADP reductase [Allosaccharopolyspora coralli]QGK70380.1 2Fe-2S iron-sulfur cluster binding domain-containing protein [Allosaccharopolyspora coralli]